MVELIDTVLDNASRHLDLLTGKTDEGREDYEAVLSAAADKVYKMTLGMPLNRW